MCSCTRVVRPSCLHGKHFTDRANFLASPRYLKEKLMFFFLSKINIKMSLVTLGVTFVPFNFSLHFSIFQMSYNRHRFAMEETKKDHLRTVSKASLRGERQECKWERETQVEEREEWGEASST